METAILVARTTRIRRLAALALLGGLAAASSLGCGGGCDGRGGDALSVVPADSAAVVVVPRMEALRGRLNAFLAGVEGASGLIDLIDARFGVDLASEDGLRRAGLDPDGGFAIFEDDGALGVAASVVSAERFNALVATRAEKGAGATVHRVDEASGLAGLADGAPSSPAADAAPAWRMAFGLARDGVALVTVTRGDADPRAAWLAQASGTSGLATSEPAATARAALGEAAGAWLVVRQPLPTPGGLGTVGAFVTPVLGRLSLWTGALALTEDRLSVHVHGAWEGEGELAAGWLTAPDAPEPLADVFPKALTAFARLRFDAGRVRRLPRFLRETVLPSTFPGAVGARLPTPAELLELASGELAVAVLGLDPDTSVEQMTQAARRPESFLQQLHAAGGLRVRDAAAAKALLDRAADGLRQDGYAVDAVSQGGYVGYSVRRDKPVREAWSLLLRGDALVLLSGEGEAERFLDVAQGRGVTVAKAADETLGPGLLAGDGPALGVLTTFPRITRELAEKGLPPYFLKLINDIRAVGISLGVEPGGVDLGLEVAL
ncbi:MAG: hypothetical protein H6744_09915 [Deltaproteobacteria bacterium]|nr:hypothetical protein [Deltaproteobacteria bacterium]MCB9786993.1 hypothetical protein [Deltaproteobacteria bacterium]